MIAAVAVILVEAVVIIVVAIIIVAGFPSALLATADVDEIKAESALEPQREQVHASLSSCGLTVSTSHVQRGPSKLNNKRRNVQPDTPSPTLPFVRRVTALLTLHNSFILVSCIDLGS